MTMKEYKKHSLDVLFYQDSDAAEKSKPFC